MGCRGEGILSFALPLLCRDPRVGFSSDLLALASWEEFDFSLSNEAIWEVEAVTRDESATFLRHMPFLVLVTRSQRLCLCVCLAMLLLWSPAQVPFW